MAKSKVFSGVIWASFQRFGNIVINFVSTMVMARLLTPTDFGTIGMLTFFLAITQTFVDSGFGAALIQKKEIDYKDINTVFYINMGLSLLMYCILFICAPLIADFYDTEIVCPLLRVMGLVLLIQGVTLIQQIQFQKEMNFKTLSICNFSGSVILAIVGIVAALLDCGVWSFVIRALAGAIATSLLLWVASKWRPQLCFNIDSFRQLFNFGGFILLSSLCITVSNNIQSLIIGKLFTPSMLGNFTQARTLRNIPADSIQQVMGQVLYPEFSRFQDNNAAINDKLNKCVYILSYVVVPMMLLCVLIAKPLILFFFGTRWIDAVPYFQILCIGGIPYCVQDVNINIIKAKGKSKMLFIINVIKVFVFCTMIVVASMLWGMYGLLWVMVLYSYLAYLCFAIVGTYCIKSNIYAQLLNIAKSMLFAIVPFLLLYFFIEQTESWTAFLQILVFSAAYFIIYIGISWAFKSEALMYLIHQFAPKSKRE